MRVGSCVEPPKRGDGYVANAMRLIFVLIGGGGGYVAVVFC